MTVKIAKFCDRLIIRFGACVSSSRLAQDTDYLFGRCTESCDGFDGIYCPNHATAMNNSISSFP
jgi:hypothetical protein